MFQLSILCGAGLLAAAQAGASQADAPVAAVATVEVKADADTQRRGDTASRIVVTREELVKYGDRSVLEAMKRLPGVTVNDGGVRMRGLGGGYTQLLVNGERAPAGFSLESLAPESIERIEVLRAGSAEFSLEAIAGTINIVLRRAVTTHSAEIKAGTGGSHGSRAPRLNLAWSGKRERFSYTLGADLADNDRLRHASRETGTARDAQGEVVELRSMDSRYDRAGHSANTNARLNWDLGGGDSLAWQGFFNGSRSSGTEDNRTTTLAGPAYPLPTLLADYGFVARSLRSEFSLVKRFGAARLSAKLGVYDSDTERRLGRTGLRDGAVVQGIEMGTEVHDRGVTSTGKILAPFMEGHAFAVGWDLGRSRLGQRDVQDGRDLSAGTAGTVGTAPLDYDNGFAATLTRLAVYAQDEWDVGRGWSVYVGARWEGVDIATSGSNFADSAARYSIFSPLAQVLWKIPGAKNDQLRLALTRTYRAPPLARLVPTRFYRSFNTQVEPDFIGNPDLEPELATGLDAAWEHYFEAGGMVSLSASARRIRQTIRNETAFDGLRWISRPVNGGAAGVQSVEAEAKLPAKTLGLAWPLELRASLARNWSRVDAVPGPDNRLERQPRWSGNLGLDYQRGPVGAGASFAFVSGGWTRTSLPQFAYGGVTRELAAYLLYRFDPKRQLRLSASNLLSPDRLDAARYVDAAGSRETATSTQTFRGWRLQYEHKF